MSKRKDTQPPADEPTFEEALARLEEIADRLEDEELPLETSLKLFEEGVALSRRCGTRLEAAEKKVEALVRRADGTLAEEPFEPDDEDA